MKIEKTTVPASAQIIPFPEPGSAKLKSLKLRKEPRSLAEQRTPMQLACATKKEPMIVYGSSWYHEVAILDAEVFPKR